MLVNVLDSISVYAVGKCRILSDVFVYAVGKCRIVQSIKSVYAIIEVILVRYLQLAIK